MVPQTQIDVVMVAMGTVMAVMEKVVAVMTVKYWCFVQEFINKMFDSR